MEDYPRSVEEFEQRFSNERACRDYLYRLRWPEGFRCPRCGRDKAWAVGSTWLECAACHHQTSVTAGTVFQDTRKPLRCWFRAMWYMTRQKNGASALGLKRVLGLGSYQTAWAWLHKLRRAMVRPGREPARLHRRLYRARQHGSYGCLAGLCRPREEGLQPRGQPYPTSA